MALKDLDAKTILAFLQNLEGGQAGRGNSVRTRNQRLAAIQTFFKYLSLHVPAVEQQARRVLAIPCKRAPSKPADSLTSKELEILLQQPQTSTMDGFRDLALLVFLYNSGARAQEAADLRTASFDFICSTRQPYTERGERSYRQHVETMLDWVSSSRQGVIRPYKLRREHLVGIEEVFEADMVCASNRDRFPQAAYIKEQEIPGT